jgi:DNA-binding GntR family transcriptional regulator
VSLETSHTYRLLRALECAPMTTRSLAEHLGASVSVIRARLAELRTLGAVGVVGSKPQGAYALKLWGIAP